MDKQLEKIFNKQVDYTKAVIEWIWTNRKKIMNMNAESEKGETCSFHEDPESYGLPNHLYSTMSTDMVDKIQETINSASENNNKIDRKHLVWNLIGDNCI